MAELDIKIKVAGEENLKALKNNIDGITEKSTMSTKAIAGWTAALAAGAIAVNAVFGAGRKYLSQLEDLSEYQKSATELEKELSNSFSMASASLLEYTGVYEAYKTVLQETSDLLDGLAGREAILHEARRERQKDLDDWAKLDAENTKMVAVEKEKAAKAAFASLRLQQKSDREWQAEQAKKLKALEDQKAAYEAQLVANDAAIDAINAETDAQIKNIQAKNEAVEVTDDLTESLERQADASGSAAGSGTHSMVISSGQSMENDRAYADSLFRQGRFGESEAMLAQISRQLADSYREQRETNRLIGR